MGVVLLRVMMGLRAVTWPGHVCACLGAALYALESCRVTAVRPDSPNFIDKAIQEAGFALKVERCSAGDLRHAEGLPVRFSVDSNSQLAATGG